MAVVVPSVERWVWFLPDNGGGIWLLAGCEGRDWHMLGFGICDGFTLGGGGSGCCWIGTLGAGMGGWDDVACYWHSVAREVKISISFWRMMQWEHVFLVVLESGSKVLGSINNGCGLRELWEMMDEFHHVGNASGITGRYVALYAMVVLYY